MIETVNTKDISRADRLATLNRSLHATPFFNLMDFEVVSTAAKIRDYAAKVEINKDFYLTEIRGNFGEVHSVTNSFFDVSIYTTLRHESVYHFGRNNPLPSGFIMGEARRDTPLGSQVFDDRQRESIPYLIQNGDKVIAEIQNAQANEHAELANIVLSGFTITEYPYLDELTTEKINESLDSPVQYQLFRVNITQNGLNDYNIVNDQKPRLILGFGIVNTFLSSISRATVLIKDTSRNQKWNNIAMPIEFLAPRVGAQVLDVTKYYLPVEYFFQPFDNLQFTIDNQENISVRTFQLVMLTRTI